MYRRAINLAVPLAVAALTLSACGGGADDGASVRNLNADGSETGSGSGSVSGSASGPASASGSASGSATAPAGDASASGELGGYEPVSDVDSHAQLVLDMCEVNEALPGDGEPDYDAARRAYAQGGNSPKDGSTRTLQGAATGEHDEPLWNRYVDYFGSASFADDFVTAALDGSGEFEGEPDAVRRQGVQKGVQNHVLMAYVYHELDAAAAKLKAGETDEATGAPHNIDEAWAFYHGAEPSCAPYATASKRGADFATGESVNEALLNATERMRDAASGGDEEVFEEAYDEFVSTSLVPYLQATMKYADVMGDDLAGGDEDAARVHQAEGYAFWRVVAPFVAEADADAADEVESLLTLSAPPSEDAGDTVRDALEGVSDELEVDADQIGELQG